jgi:hypothetical protein
MNKKYPVQLLYIWSVCFITSFKKTKTNNGYTNVSIKAFKKTRFDKVKDKQIILCENVMCLTYF